MFDFSLEGTLMEDSGRRRWFWDQNRKFGVISVGCWRAVEDEARRAREGKLGWREIRKVARRWGRWWTDGGQWKTRSRERRKSGWRNRGSIGKRGKGKWGAMGRRNGRGVAGAKDDRREELEEGVQMRAAAAAQGRQWRCKGGSGNDGILMAGVRSGGGRGGGGNGGT